MQKFKISEICFLCSLFFVSMFFYYKRHEYILYIIINSTSSYINIDKSCHQIINA